MTFSDSVQTCFKKYATFSGRARRPEFWKFVLFIFLASIVLAAIDGLIFGPSMVENHESGSKGPLASIFSLLTILPVLAVTWRRLHDTGRPGWYAFLPLLVSTGLFFFLFVGVFGFSMMENAGVPQEALVGAATALGVTGIVIAVLFQLGLTALLIWWLTRPSDASTNAYGPEPQ
jgi:uncharacterized membrane protein YhaH (DUF805 family)